MPAAAIAVIILAAGKGTRMQSALPKVLHRIGHKPMIAHVLEAALHLAPAQLALVVAPGMQQVREAVSALHPPAQCAEQAEQLGTGHAVRMALPLLEDFTGDVLVVYGDTPLITPENLQLLLQTKHAHNAAIALLAMQPRDVTGYGRVVMEQPPLVTRIVECKDASAAEKAIPHVWGGVMAFDAAFLREALPRLAPSPVTGEYYLTALIEMARAAGLKTVMAPMREDEAMGVNDRAQLAQAEAVFQQRLRLRAMLGGATLIAPETVFFAADTQLARDVVVHPFVTFGPGVQVGEGAEIRSYCHLESASVGARSTIGPYARLRPGTVLEEGVHIGNFVELKATHAARGAKINHLSYVGDAQVGAGANVGAGTITCNYDGFAKHRTVIGAGAFIGSNTSLVAPVSVGEGAVVGAGSVVTQDVPPDALYVARSTPDLREGAAARMRARKK